jgi:hypothetical protein
MRVAWDRQYLPVSGHLAASRLLHAQGYSLIQKPLILR